MVVFAEIVVVAAAMWLDGPASFFGISRARTAGGEIRMIWRENKMFHNSRDVLQQHNIISVYSLGQVLHRVPISKTLK